MEKQLDIVFLKPKRFADCDLCANYINQEKIVHLNLKSLDANTAQRVYDYISGSVYIKEATLLDLDEGILCCVPKDKDFKFDYPQQGHNDMEDTEIIPFAK